MGLLFDWFTLGQLQLTPVDIAGLEQRIEEGFSFEVGVDAGTSPVRFVARHKHYRARQQFLDLKN